MPKMKKRLTPIERAEAEKVIAAKLLSGEVSVGDAVREMRQEWLGLRQERYAQMCGVSRNTLSAIERNSGNATVDTVNRILKPFGYRLSAIRPVQD